MWGRGKNKTDEVPALPALRSSHEAASYRCTWGIIMQKRAHLVREKYYTTCFLGHNPGDLSSGLDGPGDGLSDSFSEELQGEHPK